MYIYCYSSSSRVTGLGFLYSMMCFSFGQIPPLARYLLWLDTSFDQIPSLTCYLLWQHISSGNISSPAIYLLRNISPPETCLLCQHISSSNISPPVIYCFSHSSNLTKQFPFLWTDCFLDCPSYHFGELANFFVISMLELEPN